MSHQQRGDGLLERPWGCTRQSTDDHRESAFLFQRLSVLIQRYNADAVLGTVTHTTPTTKCSRSSICSSFSLSL